MIKDCPERRELVLANLRDGHCLELAAAGAGITYQTLRNWRKADKEFDEECDIAAGQGVMPIEAKLKHIAVEKMDLNAIKFILERRKQTREAYAPAQHNSPLVAIQANYLNPLAQLAPGLLSRQEAIEGEVVQPLLETSQ